MRKYIVLILFLMIFAYLSAACGQNEVPAQSAATPSPTGTPAPTPTPDYTNTDFSGTWYVSGVFASNGTTLNSREMQALGADFTMEILADGIYYIYDAEGAAIGKGDYLVSHKRLTCFADGQKTVYEIQDADTLICTAADNSVTVMSRRPPEPEEETGDRETHSGEETETS